MTKKRSLAGSVLTTLFLFSPGSLCPQEYATNILVLSSYHPDVPWDEEFNRGLQDARKEFGGTIDFYHEYMDSIRISEPLEDEAWEEYLSKKYESIHFDAIIADSYNASLFINNHEQILGDIPKILYAGVPLEKKPKTYYLTTQYHDAVEMTAETALRQNPDIRNILIIDGANPTSSTVTDILLSELASHQDINTTILRDFTVSELLQQIHELPDDTIIFYTLVHSDATGKTYIPKEILIEVVAETEAPVYSFWGSLMGSGIVGGYMNDGVKTGKEMVRAAMDYTATGTFSDSYTTLAAYLDWKALKRYGIRRRDIPKDVIIINKPVSIFVSNFREVMLAIIIIIASLLILTLFWVKQITTANRKLKEANLQIEEAKQIAEQLARTDPLTGLLNRRAARPVLAVEMRRADRFHIPESLLMLDIDHFKRINDTQGHDAGDTVLMMLSRTVVGICRSTDSIARWGGEEFLILAAHTDEENAMALAEKIRIAIRAMKIDGIRSITVSIGVSEYRPGEAFRDWFKRVDTALYLAKEGGRNRCVLVTGKSPGIDEGREHS